MEPRVASVSMEIAVAAGGATDSGGPDDERNGPYANAQRMLAEYARTAYSAPSRRAAAVAV